MRHPKPGFSIYHLKQSYFLIYFRAPDHGGASLFWGTLSASSFWWVRDFLEGSREANSQDTTCSQAIRRKSKGNMSPRHWTHGWPLSILVFSHLGNLCPIWPFPLEVTDITVLQILTKKEKDSHYPNVRGKFWAESETSISSTLLQPSKKPEEMRAKWYRWPRNFYFLPLK